VTATQYPTTECALIAGIGFPGGLAFPRGLWEYLAARTRARAEVEKARIALEKDRDRSRAVAGYIGLVPEGAELVDLDDGTGRSIWIRKGAASLTPKRRRSRALQLRGKGLSMNGALHQFNTARDARQFEPFRLVRGKHAVDRMRWEGDPELDAGGPIALPRALHTGIRVMARHRRQRCGIPAHHRVAPEVGRKDVQQPRDRARLEVLAAGRTHVCRPVRRQVDTHPRTISRGSEQEFDKALRV
jgi:hypothetical protein